LSAYLDRELAASEADAVAAHLRSCPECSKAHQDQLRLNAVLDSCEELVPSSGFDPSFRRRLEQAKREERIVQTPKRSFWQSFGLPALVSVAAAAFAAVMVATGTFGKDPVIPERDRLEVAKHLELLQNYDVIEKLDALEDFDVVRQLDRLQGAIR
jgi:anti-sigma factor RsiW